MLWLKWPICFDVPIDALVQVTYMLWCAYRCFGSSDLYAWCALTSGQDGLPLVGIKTLNKEKWHSDAVYPFSLYFILILLSQKCPLKTLKTRKEIFKLKLYSRPLLTLFACSTYETDRLTMYILFIMCIEKAWM